jgi:hypothetical protein
MLALLAFPHLRSDEERRRSTRMNHAKQNKLWTCPKCGHSFVTKDIWHSCGTFELDEHFKNKDPIVRSLFDKYRTMVESCGEIVCYPQKTRIVFMVRMRFAGCVTRRTYLQCALLLPDRHEYAPRLHKIEKFGENSYGHYFNIRELRELDRDFLKLIRAAYKVGRQARLKSKKKSA